MDDDAVAPRMSLPQQRDFEYADLAALLQKEVYSFRGKDAV